MILVWSSKAGKVVDKSLAAANSRVWLQSFESCLFDPAEVKGPLVGGKSGAKTGTFPGCLICWLFLECGSLSYEHDTPCQARWTLPLSSLAHPKSNLIYELLLSQEGNVWNSGKQQIHSFSACSFSSAYTDWPISFDPFHVSNLSVSSVCIRFGCSFCISIGVHPNMWSIPGWWIDISEHSGISIGLEKVTTCKTCCPMRMRALTRSNSCSWRIESKPSQDMSCCTVCHSFWNRRYRIPTSGQHAIKQGSNSMFQNICALLQVPVVPAMSPTWANAIVPKLLLRHCSRFFLSYWKIGNWKGEERLQLYNEFPFSLLPWGASGMNSAWELLSYHLAC